MNKIKHYRLLALLTQEGLGKQAGIGGQSAISNYEAGTRTPDLQACRQIVDALNQTGLQVTLDDVFPPSADDEAA